jgi:glyoxylase-like metal-dependent hydrolase (beta-lactamase superfamily II)
MSNEPYWSIAPLNLGMAIRDKSFSIFFKDPGVKSEGMAIAWLLMRGKDKVLVDTGPLVLPETAEFHKPFTQTEEQTLEAQLMRFNTTPDDIEMVINTHLHWDHCYGNSLMKRARFFVQKREMDYARNPLPLHEKAYEVRQEGVIPPYEGIHFDFLEGDADLAPGIRVLLTPGHTPGIQTICVQTREGLYIIAGDNIPFFENMAVPDHRPFWPNPVFVDLKDYYESLDRVKRLKGFILPGHDPQVASKSIYP